MEYRVNMGILGRYRHFIVTADSPEQARQRFTDAAHSPHGWRITHGFTEKDIHSIVPIEAEKGE